MAKKKAKKKVRRKPTKKKTVKSRKKAKKRTAKVRKKVGKIKKTLAKRKKAVKALKEAPELSLGERLHHLLTETSVVVYTAKPAGDYPATFVSDNVKRMTGYSYKSFVREPSFWFAHVHPDDQKRVLEEIPQIFEDKYYEYEYRFRHKKGHYIWVHDEMKLHCDNKGNPVEIVGFWTDITRRKAAEAGLKQASERLASFADSATEGFVIVDPGFKIIRINKYLQNQFNVTEEDIVGQNFLDVSRDAYESGRYEKYLEVLETGKPCFFEDLLTPPEFGDRHMNVTAFKVGECLGLIVRDVTEEKKSERELKESEERFRSLFDATIAGVVFQDSDGKVIRVNKQACEILDFDEDELVGASLMELCSHLVNEKGEDLKDEEHPLIQTLKTCEPVRNKIVGMALDFPAERRWLLVNTEPIFDPYTEKLDEVLCTFIDITEQKNIEDALEESEKRYRHIFEHCPIGIGISGMDGRVITANRAMLEIMGYTLDEVRKINLADTYVNVDDRRKMLQDLNQYGRVTDYRIQLKRKDGMPYNAILNISRINIGGTDYYHTMCQKVS